MAFTILMGVILIKFLLYIWLNESLFLITRLWGFVVLVTNITLYVVLRYSFAKDLNIAPNIYSALFLLHIATQIRY